MRNLKHPLVGAVRLQAARRLGMPARLRRMLRDMPDPDHMRRAYGQKIYERILPRFPSAEAAAGWMIDEGLPGFCSMTAMDLIAEDKGQWVFDYLDAVDAGVSA